MLKVNTYRVLSLCVENGVDRGLARRAEDPGRMYSPAEIKEMLMDEILDEICTYFDIVEEKVEW